MEKILLVPHPKLREKSEEINKVTKTEINIAEKMKRIMKEAPGVGLAANQIGILKKIVTIHISDNEKKINDIKILFNPIITFYSKKKFLFFHLYLYI